MGELIYKGEPSTIRSGALTTSLDAAANAVELATPLDSYVTLFLDYVVGTGGTGITYLVECSPVASGDDWFPAEEALDSSATASSGTTTIPSSAARYSVVVATPRRVHTVPTYGVKRLRVRALESGAPSPAGTLTVRAVASRVGA